MSLYFHVARLGRRLAQAAGLVRGQSVGVKMQDSIEALESRQLLAPDLVASIAAFAGTEYSAGSEYTVTVGAQNNGDTLGTGLTARYGLYMSRGNSVNYSTDRLLGSFSKTAFFSGDTDAQPITFRIPNDISNGSYRLFAVADTGNTVPENDESNNVSSPLAVNVTGGTGGNGGGGGGGGGNEPTLKPDLTVAIAPILEPLVPFVENRVSVTAQNVGEGPSLEGAEVQIFLQRGVNQNISSDRRIGSMLIGPMTVNQSSTQSVGFTIPANLSQGQVRIYAVVDRSGVISETNETNNRTASIAAFFPLPSYDLTGVAIRSTLPEALVQGQGSPSSASVKYDFTNLSNQAFANGTRVAVQAYLRPVGDSSGAGDVAVSTVRQETIGGMKAQSSRTRVTKIKVPSAINAGEYRLIVKLDQAGGLAEVNEQNNIIDFGQVIRIDAARIDLVPSAAVVSTSLSRGVTQVRTDLSLSNVGNTPFKGNVTIQFFFLNENGDQIGDVAPITKRVDLRLGRVTKVSGLKVTPAIPAGTYTLAAYVSLPDGVNDSNLTNNFATFGPVTIA